MVNGWCFGGGYGPLFACDLAYCSDDAQFGLSEINWSILPGGGGTKDAVRRVREMTFGNAEDYLVRAQEALTCQDKSEGRLEGMKQFLDDKTYKPGLGEYDKSTTEG